MKQIITSILLILQASYSLNGQSIMRDTTDDHQSYLPEITVVGRSSSNDYQQMPEIVGTAIYAGKKNSLIIVDNVLGNKVTNTMRQVMAKVPGIHIWESDGSGIQVGIASRGLSPNRSWEFNVKQNGYDIAADPFGYPEAYYNPQMQAVQRLEVVRGQSALQYGPQIGGLINYILKDGNHLSKAFNIESEQTIGSNGLINTFNAIGGKTTKLHYYGFYDHRAADGYRANSRYQTGTFFGTVTFNIASKTQLSLEGTKWSMLSQQPGGLTDHQLYHDSKISYRSRNWMQLDWKIGAMTLAHTWKERNKLQLKIFVMHADRNSVGFVPSGGILIADTLNKTIGSFNPRTIDIDRYINYGAESKWLQDIKLGGKRHILTAGLKIYQGQTDRWRGGRENGSGLDFTIEKNPANAWNAVIDYHTFNAAIYAESVLKLGTKLLIIPGFRSEYLAGEASGSSGLKDNTPIPLIARSKSRSFTLFGLSGEYHLGNLEAYGGIHQSYRPIQFADLTTPPTSDELDPNLKDSKAITADLGVRGDLVKGLRVDAGVYHMKYQNRIGTIRQQRLDGTFYNYRTNIGASTSVGFECLLEWNIQKSTKEHYDAEWIPFISYAYNHATYDKLKITTQIGNQIKETILNGNKIENAPTHILRTGIEFRSGPIKAQAGYSYTSSMYTDANNTIIPTANAQNGGIPAYHITDLSLQYKFKKYISLKGGVNNLTNEVYFTRRAGGYPGPGALPSDGRSVWLSLSFIW